MITYIEGKVINIISSDKYDTIEIVINSGIGYEVFIPSNKITPLIGKYILLHSFFIVRDYFQAIYGFISREDKRLFMLLNTVSGVGPKGAIGIMSRFSSNQIAKLVKQGDHKSLSSVSGLGSKGAQKIVVELRDKLDWIDSTNAEATVEESILKELKEALKSLGFDNNRINESVSQAKDLLKEKSYTLEQLIKYALSE